MGVDVGVGMVMVMGWGGAGQWASTPMDVMRIPVSSPYDGSTCLLSTVWYAPYCNRKQEPPPGSTK